MKHFCHIILSCVVFGLLFSACRDEEVVVPTQLSPLYDADAAKASEYGLYILCEGNMGSNKSSIDFLDFHSGVYMRNIYAERNPNAVKELGDVGNDICIYGDRLYVVVNCSNKVEVLDARSCRRIGQIDIANCRNVIFYEGKGYVSSYVGGASEVSGTIGCGEVCRFDTATLSVDARVGVGYQPEQMAIVDGQLYVANSGGYMPPTFDDRLTQIDLMSFSVVRHLSVGSINLCRLQSDDYGRLWLTSLGNFNDVPGDLLLLAPDASGDMAVQHRFGFPCSDMAIHDGTLYFFSSVWDDVSQGSRISYGTIDLVSLRVNTKGFIADGFERDIVMPYAITIHPHTGDIYVADARNYISSGRLFCFSKEGIKKWSVSTGDIPGHFCFLDQAPEIHDTPIDEPSDGFSPYTSRVLEYCPAPGQFVNVMPLYEEGDDEQTMVHKAEMSICSGGMVTLGGFGGYVTFAFDHSVVNAPDRADFAIRGNATRSPMAADKSRYGGSSEPGIVWVSSDANGNGLPDDVWYELAGSDYHNAMTKHDFRLTYRQDADGVVWSDADGMSGRIEKNQYHDQPYFPQWTEGTLSFCGTLLPSNAEKEGSMWILYSYAWGYADNHPNSDIALNSFDIEWAVNANGRSVSLPSVDFIRVCTGLHQTCGQLGETSTEVGRAVDLNLADSY